MENFIVTVEDKDYFIIPYDYKDQVLYEVRDGTQVITTIGLNEEANWEGSNQYPADIILKIGEAIEQKSM